MAEKNRRRGRPTVNAKYFTESIRDSDNFIHYRHSPSPINRSMSPTTNNDDDVNMDAPQISTLGEEDSPPPEQPPQRASGLRLKLLVKSPKKGADDEEEDDDQEDQLIDDDAPMRSSIPEAATAKRKSASKQNTPRKRARKADKEKVPEESVLKEKTDSWVEENPPTEHQDPVSETSQVTITIPSSEATSSTAKKRKAPVRTLKKPKVTPSKLVTSTLPLPAIEPDVMSEAAFTATAASSPVTTHFENNTPEPEVASAPIVTDEYNLETYPLPKYPLPTKPFPVQVAPKLPTGVAPIIPLDRSGKKVRKWRVANREIRGIAGGRWFAKTWVGSKDSELASAASIALPKLSVKGRGRSVKGTASSVSASAAPSRAGSVVPKV